MDDPVRLTPPFVNYNGTVARSDGEIRAVMIQFHKISNDGLFFVPKRYDEFVHVIEGVMLHNMPKNRPAADLYHWFRARIRFLGEPRSHSTCKNYYPHRVSQMFMRRLRN